MRGLVATTAVLGVLAIGGLPALALTLAAEETGPGREPATTLVQDSESPGPPPWAHGRGRPEGPGDDVEAEGEGVPPWATGGDREPPPGWERNHDGATPHGWAVREWARCVAAEAGDREPGDRLDREAACGPRPVPPGHADARPGASDEPPGQQGRHEPPGQQMKSTQPGQQGQHEPPGQQKKSTQPPSR